MSEDEPRPWYTDVPGEGRLDVNGVEWFACDPYPTWFRWEGKTLHTNPARWADLPPVDPNAEKYSHPIYGSGAHRTDCDQRIKTRWSGVACDCGARWFCW